jgi:hypothetical protein
MSNQRSAQEIRDYQSAWMAHALAAEHEREESAREAAEAKAAEAHRVSLMLQNAQREWAQVRNSLRDQVAQLRGLLAGAEGRMASSDMDLAVRAAGEAEVYRARLAQAEQGFANHMRTQPL